ncbi:MAG: rRNA maturation RNase YbeY [Taibaiella sp.]|nr:rRNA maturation RNase YbeY [Taibaiella sp.]
MPAEFHELEVKSKLKDKRKLSAFMDSAVARYAKGVKRANLTYIFCSDEHLLQMNQQFLDHNTFTDIITFDLSEADDTMEGEIYVSVDRVRENAEKFGVPYDNELHRVLFHGMLHLCGFKDKKDADKKLMRTKEDECIAAYYKELSK